MANAFYNKARQRAATTGLNWLLGDIRVALIDAADYTFSASHEFLSSVASAAFVAPTSGVQTGTALSSKSATDGACDAADVVFTTVSGDQSEALIIFEWITNAADSLLIAYIDTVTGLPILPNGGNITIQWDAGATKILRP